MAPLPDYRPKQLSLGPLESEILDLVWELGLTSARDVHERILADLDRELSYSSVTTVLQRLTQKGWLLFCKKGKVIYWQARLTKAEAQAIRSYDQLHLFLQMSNPDLVASFADSLDTASCEQLESIASRLQALKKEKKQ
jgi:predicted transcriptional regulator